MRYFTGGFVKIPRMDILDVMLVGHTGAMLVLQTLYAIAAYRPCDGKIGRKRVRLEVGQAAVSVPQIMKLTGLSRQQTRTALEFLKDNHKVNLNHNPKGMIVTVCNYSIYDETNDDDNHNKNHQPTTDQPQLLENNHNTNPTDEPPPYYNYEEIQDYDSASNTTDNQTLRMEEGKKEEESSLLSGGNYPARARPGDNDHHEGGKSQPAKKPDLKEALAMQKLLPGKNDNAQIARLIQLAKDKFDPAFRNERARGKSGGFSFEKANDLIAGLVIEHGWERASEFGDYLFAYKRCARKQQIRLSEVPIIFERFKTGETIAELESRISR